MISIMSQGDRLENINRGTVLEQIWHNAKGYMTVAVVCFLMNQYLPESACTTLDES